LNKCEWGKNYGKKGAREVFICALQEKEKYYFGEGREKMVFAPAYM
jgi:hypothetical protein